MKHETGCDAVMIGRAAIGNPWIFSQIITVLNGHNCLPVEVKHRFDGMIRYLKSSVEYLGEERACKIMRSRLGWFVKGLPDSSGFRNSITQISTQDQALELIESYRNELRSG
jgi:tRNA-dihydrouridine synthase